MFNLVGITARSAAWELSNRECFFAPVKYKVYLNDKLLLQSFDRNVGSLFGLKPETSYVLGIEFENGVAGEYSFTTPRETVRLNVRDFGAAGDGIKDDTSAIQAALLSTPAGGTVLVPPGEYSIHSLFLVSNVTLELAGNARLIAQTDRTVYPILPGSTESDSRDKEYFLGTWEGNPQNCFAGIITGVNVENAAVIGEGTIDGNAQNGDWWVDHHIKRISWRPKSLFLAHCRNILIHGVTIKNSPSWTCHPWFSERISFIDVDIESPWDSPNTDGIDPESCSDLLVLGVRISVGDDCVAIKSGALYMGRRFKRPTERCVFRNCYMEAGHGGIVLGSEMAGGIQDIKVSQCYFNGTDRGLRIKTRRGRGKDAVIDGITFQNIYMKKVKAPLVINMYYDCGPDGKTPYVWSKEPMEVDERTPFLGKFEFRDMICEECETAAAFFYGLPEQPVEEIAVRNVSFKFSADAESFVPAMMSFLEPMRKQGIHAVNVKKLILENVELYGHDGEDLVLEKVGSVTRS